MKAFRGAAIALIVLAAVFAVVWVVKPDIIAQPETEVQLFPFEKHELVRVQIDRPPTIVDQDGSVREGDTIVLSESDGKWNIEGTDFKPGRSMINRVKHQYHDLTSRAQVVEEGDLEGIPAELFGLGKNAIRVKLTLRSGRDIEFFVGDPNPTRVSYYIQRIEEGKPEPVIWTVKKSASDFPSLALDEFRERRFASFDSKDVTRLTAIVRFDGIENRDGTTLSADHTLDLELVGEDHWEMRSPDQMRANTDRVKRLMGRVSALKASAFIELGVEEGQKVPAEKLAEYGLHAPRADVTIEFASRDPLRLFVGADAPSDNKYEELCYMLIDGDNTVYVARRGLLEEYGQAPGELRNRRVVELKSADVVSVDAVLYPDPDDSLEGEAGVRYLADVWVWKDGVPVSGSTPERVAKRLAELDVDAFIADDARDLAEYGLDQPKARIVLATEEGTEKVVLIGKEGEPEVDPEGRERARRYVAIEGKDSVYLVDEGVLKVAQDMIREYNRKAKKDKETMERQQRIESVAAPEEESP